MQEVGLEEGDWVCCLSLLLRGPTQQPVDLPEVEVEPGEDTYLAFLFRDDIKVEFE